MRAEALLREIDPLAYVERCRRLAVHGRRLAGTPELSTLLRDLAGWGQYGRRTALTLAVVGTDTGYVAAALSEPDPDAELRRAVLAAAVRLPVADRTLADAVENAPADLRRLAYRAIRRRRRSSLAEMLLPRVRARYGDREAGALLPACGADLVAAVLDDLAYALPSLTAIARHHPGPLLDHLERSLADRPALRRKLWAKHRRVLDLLADLDPARVLNLLERFGGRGLPISRLAPLLAADPARTAAWLARPERDWRQQPRLRPAELRRVAALADGHLLPVARAVRGSAPLFAALLGALPPSRRGTVFAAATAAEDLSQTVLSDDLVEVLPHRIRAEHARRMLALRQVADDPAHVLRITAYLPFAQAREALVDATRRPRGEDRAEGYRLLVACACRERDPAAWGEALALLTRLRNEQDPVRSVVLRQLAAAAPGLWRAEHMPAVERTVDDALAARDCSWQSTNAMTALASRLMSQGAAAADPALVDVALTTLERLAGHHGYLPLPRLDLVLRRGQELDLVTMLTPALTAQAERGRFRLALSLARSLGRRGWTVPAVQDALGRALREASDDWVIRAAATAWLAAPATRDERVAELLRIDRSMVTFPAVIDLVARRRTDLLSVVLGRRPPTGRFLHSKIRWVPEPDPRALARWTPDQTAAFQALLRRLVDDSGAPEADRMRALRLLCRIPGTRPAELRGALDASSSSALAIRTALTGLSWTSQPAEALPVLLAYADGDHAHVALASAVRCARFVTPPELGAALAPVLTNGKVTARKEAVRLIARHRTPRAAELIEAAWHRPDQHPDIKVAIVAALRDMLDDGRTWRLLDAAVDGPRDCALEVLRGSPDGMRPEHRRRYANLDCRAATADDVTIRKAALQALPQWAPWSPTAMQVLAGVVADQRDTATWSIAATGLTACATTPGLGTADLANAAAALAAQEPGEAGHPDRDAAPDRDRPARQRLDRLADLLRDAAARNRDDAAAAIEALRATLAGLPSFTATRATLTVAAIDVHRDLAAQLGALADQMTGWPLATVEACGVLASRLAVTEWDPGSLHDAAATLTARDDLAGGLLALTTVRAGASRTQWAAPWRDELRRLRRHQHPEVRAAALEVFTNAE